MKKVAIIGCGKSWVNAPFTDSSYEKWSLNDIHELIPYELCTRWFEIHDLNSLKLERTRFSGKPYIDGLHKLNIPIVMREKIPEFETSITYPFEEIFKHFKKYVHNTIAYMLLLAMYEGFELIELHGVDMRNMDMPNISIALCVAYWIGVAEEKGIKVIIPKTSILHHREFLYGGCDERA
jgi:hypothetical protein